MRRRVTVVFLSVCVCVCVCVCLSVKSHLTSGASVRPENTVTYSAGNGGQKSFSLKPLRCGDPALLLWKPYVRSAIILRKACMRIMGHEYPRRGFCTLVHSLKPEMTMHLHSQREPDARACLIRTAVSVLLKRSVLKSHERGESHIECGNV